MCVPLLNLNRTHAPSEGDGRTIHDNIYIYIYIYIYTDSAGVDWTRRGSLRLAPIRKWLPNMVKLSGVLDSAHSREDTNILLAEIILRSDYSRSVKELW